MLRGVLRLPRKRCWLCLCLWLAVDDSFGAPLADMRTGRLHKMRLHVLPRCAGGCVVLQLFLCSGSFFDVSSSGCGSFLALAAFSGVKAVARLSHARALRDEALDVQVGIRSEGFARAHACSSDGGTWIGGTQWSPFWHAFPEPRRQRGRVDVERVWKSGRGRAKAGTRRCEFPRSATSRRSPI